MEHAKRCGVCQHPTTDHHRQLLLLQCRVDKHPGRRRIQLVRSQAESASRDLAHQGQPAAIDLLVECPVPICRAHLGALYGSPLARVAEHLLSAVGHIPAERHTKSSQYDELSWLLIHTNLSLHPGWNHHDAYIVCAGVPQIQIHDAGGGVF